LADEITAPVASRSLARSPLGYGHDPDGTEALGEAASTTPGTSRTGPTSRTAIINAEARRLTALFDPRRSLIAQIRFETGSFQFVALSWRRVPGTSRSVHAALLTDSQASAATGRNAVKAGAGG
jgi:hypothetical protein